MIGTTLRREPLFFAVTLVALGGWTALSLGDRYVPRGVPAARTLEASLPPEPARVEAGTLRPAPEGERGSPAFAPPRELLPLDPVDLPPPPLPALPVRRAAVSPSLAGEHARAYRVPPDSLGDLDLGDEDALALAVESERTDAPADADAAPPESPFASAAGAEQRFDWVSRRGSSRRLYGSILNDDPHGLAERPAEAIRFQQVSEATGRPLGAPYELDRVDVVEFGLARTFANRYTAASRAIGSGAGSVAARTALALEMLAAWPDEPRALEFALAEAEAARAAAPDDPDAARLLATVRRVAHDLEGELAVYVDAEARGVADAALLADHGRLARRLGLPERARELLAEARRASGTLGEAALLEGLLLLDEGRPAEALAQLVAADQLPLSGPLPERTEAELRLALGEARIALGRPDEARRDAERLLLDQPDHAGALTLLGAAHAAADELPAAAEAFDRAMAAAPTDARAITNAGVVAWRLGEGARARRLLLRAVDVDPLRALAPTLALGFLHEAAGEPETARDLYAAALELEPDAPEALYRLGRNQRLDGDPDAAAATLRRALRLAGSDALVLMELARASVERGRPADARRYLREALRLEPDNGELHWHDGLAALREGDLLGAVAPLERASAAGLPGAHAGLAACAYARGETDAALDHLDAVVRGYAGRPDHPQAAWAAGQAARIRDNLAKRQWLDTFCRTRLQRGWTEHVWEGSPRLWTADCALHLQGRVEATREDERPGISRLVEGRGFFAAEAAVERGEDGDGRLGLALTHRQVRGTLGRMPKARLEIRVDADGAVRLSTLDNFDVVGLDDEAVPGVTIAPGGGARLGIERTDAAAGAFRFTLGGRPVGPRVELRSLRDFGSPFELSVFADAAPGRHVDARVTLVRVVRAP